MKFLVVLSLVVLGASAKSMMLSDDITCTICTSIIAGAEEAAITDETQLQAFVDKECTKIFGKGFPGQLCTNAANDALKPLLNEIVAKLPPTTVCQHAGLCAGAKAALAQPEELSNQIFCSICEALVTDAEDAAVNDEAQLQTFVDNECKKILGNNFAGSLCCDVCNAALKPLLNDIVAKETPLVVCQSAKLCPQQTNPALVKLMEGGWFCGMCTSLVQAAENAAVNSEQALDQFIDQYCQQFFGNGFGGSLCETAVNALVGPLLNEIMQNLPPAQVCGDVGLCSVGKHAPVSSPLVGWNSNTEICDVCMGAAQALVDELTDPTIQKDIQQALLTVCKIVPGSERDTCNMIINNYFGAIWSEVLSFLNAKEICTLTKLCTS